jgi:hypothetical protein
VDPAEPAARDPMPTLERFVPLHGQLLTAVSPAFPHAQDQPTLHSAANSI